MDADLPMDEFPLRAHLARVWGIPVDLLAELIMSGSLTVFCEEADGLRRRVLRTLRKLP